jgi:hypothetical protein
MQSHDQHESSNQRTLTSATHIHQSGYVTVRPRKQGVLYIKANVCVCVCVCLSVCLLYVQDSDYNQILCSDYSEPGEKHRLHKNLTL